MYFSWENKFDYEHIMATFKIRVNLLMKLGNL